MAIDLKIIQDTIGYTFDNPDLLQQAFVRRSYSEENGGQNNEVLEFIGDKALDLAVIRLMMERFGKITEEKEWSEFKLRNPKYFQTKQSEGVFTDIKKDLVEKGALANAMDKLGFHEQLIMGEGDIKGNIQNQDSVKEDLFEAIIGAVTLDCDWDMDTITDVVETMINFDDYFENMTDPDENYVGKVQEWSQQKGYGLPYYTYEDNGDDGYICRLIIGAVNLKLSAVGDSKPKARMAVAKEAYFALEENGYILNPIKQAVGEADPDNATRQINELVQKKLISKPVAKFTQEYDKNGDSVWICDYSLPREKDGFTNMASSKKEAERLCAYELLLDLMEEA